MEVKFNIDKKIVGIIIVVAIIAIISVAFMGGYIRIGRQVAYKSEREASWAITNMSSSVEQIGSIIEDIVKRLGG